MVAARTGVAGPRAPAGITPTGTTLAWCIPDLALFASIVTLVYCLVLFDGARQLFRDSDTGWHIRTGEMILDMNSLPRTDPYSFSRGGQPWLDWEWGSDVLMGAVNRWGGLPAIALIFALAIGACTWLWFQLHWAVAGNFFVACAMASPMLSTANLHWLARPHVFSWLFLLGALWAAEKAAARFDSRFPISAAVAAAGVTAIWANMHASFFFGPLIAFLYGLGYWARPLIWDLPAGHERAKAAWFFKAAVISVAASFLNPYGWQLHIHLYRYLTDGELLARIGEFQSFNFHAAGAFQILLTLGLAGLGGVLALGQKNLAHFLLSLVLISAAIRSARGLPLVALLLLPLANGAITRSLRTAAQLRPALRRSINAFADYSGRLRVVDASVHGGALAPLFVLLAFLWMRSPAMAAHAGFPPDEFPVEASRAVEQLPSNARLLAPDKFGGYLIYRFERKRKVFFDGRSDFYGSEFMKQYNRLVEVRAGWQDQIREFGFTHALLPNRYSLIPALRQLGWKALYQDSVATLLEKGSHGP